MHVLFYPSSSTGPTAVPWCGSVCPHLASQGADSGIAEDSSVQAGSVFIVLHLHSFCTHIHAYIQCTIYNHAALNSLLVAHCGHNLEPVCRAQTSLSTKCLCKFVDQTLWSWWVEKVNSTARCHTTSGCDHHPCYVNLYHKQTSSGDTGLLHEHLQHAPFVYSLSLYC